MWEELTGYESVSTISILATVQEEGIELLLISSTNMAEEMGKLSTTDATKQAVTEAVNFSSEVKFLMNHGYPFVKNGNVWEAIIN